MNFGNTIFDNVFIIHQTPKSDKRGDLIRLYCKNEMNEFGINRDIVQINQTNTIKKGTFRGFHYQNPPFCETKIIQCMRGKILDIIIDLRQNSPTFLKHFTVELSGNEYIAIIIGEGFAHGFQTLSDNVQMLYMHTEFYKADAEAGLRYDDDRLGIKLPLEVTEISERDMNHHVIDEGFKGIYLNDNKNEL